jgi:hypothetical protein
MYLYDIALCIPRVIRYLHDTKIYKGVIKLFQLKNLITVTVQPNEQGVPNRTHKIKGIIESSKHNNQL